MKKTVNMEMEETNCVRNSNSSEFISEHFVNFSLMPSKKGNDKTNKFDDDSGRVIEDIHGLLNFVGGILVLKSKGECSQQDIDIWVRHVMERLLLTVPQSVVHSCVIIRPQNDGVFISVRKSPVFVTKNYNLFTRGPGANTVAVQDIHTCLDIISSTFSRPVIPGMDKIEHIRKAKHGANIDICEHQALEFKGYENAEKIPNKLTKDKKVGQCLSGFANLLDGGDFVMGLKENGKKSIYVFGYILSKIQQKSIKDAAAELFQSFQTKSGEKLVDGHDWMIKFIPISGSSHDTVEAEQRYLIHVKVFYVPGGVFCQEYPESYTMNTDGTLKKLEFNEWLFNMTKDEKTPESPYNPPQPIPSGHTQDPGHPKIFNVETAPNCVFNEILSVSYVPPDKMKTFMSENIENEITEVLFHIESEYLPPKEIIVQWGKKQGHSEEEITKAFHRISKMNPGSSSNNVLWITSRRWMSEMTKDAYRDTDSTNTVCHVLCLSDEGKASLTSVVAGPVHHEHTRLTARCLKQQIVSTCEDVISREAASKINLNIELFLYDLSSGDIERVENSESTALNDFVVHVSTAFGCGIIEHLTLALVTLLEMKDTWFAKWLNNVRNKKGTQDHIARLLHVDKRPNTFNQINALSGPCRITMVLYLCHKYGGSHNKDAVLVITNHPTFKTKVENYNICLTMLIRNKDDIDRVQSYDKLKCVVVNVAGNQPFPTALCGFYEAIKDNTRGCFACIFFDSKCQIYNPDCSESVIQFQKEFSDFCDANNVSRTATHMKDVHQNAYVISSYIKRNLNGNEQEQIHPQPTSSGGSVALYYTPDMLENSVHNSLIRHVRGILDSDVCMTDIAILLATQDDSSGTETVESIIKIFKSHMADVNVHRASEDGNGGIVIDTLEAYDGGLGIDIILFVAPDDSTTQCLVDDRKYRISISSRAIQRLDFLVSRPIDRDLIKAMKFDLFSILVPQAEVPQSI